MTKKIRNITEAVHDAVVDAIETTERDDVSGLAATIEYDPHHGFSANVRFKDDYNMLVFSQDEDEAQCYYDNPESLTELIVDGYDTDAITGCKLLDGEADGVRFDLEPFFECGIYFNDWTWVGLEDGKYGTLVQMDTAGNYGRIVRLDTDRRAELDRIADEHRYRDLDRLTAVDQLVEPQGE